MTSSTLPATEKQIEYARSLLVKIYGEFARETTNKFLNASHAAGKEMMYSARIPQNLNLTQMSKIIDILKDSSGYTLCARWHDKPESQAHWNVSISTETLEVIFPDLAK